MGRALTQAKRPAESRRSLPTARGGLSTKLAMGYYLRAQNSGFQERSNAIPLIAMALEAGRGKAARR